MGNVPSIDQCIIREGIKVKKVKNAIKATLDQQESRVDDILELVKKQHDY